MAIVGGLDIHRRQLTFDYADTATGEVRTGRIAPADRAHLAGTVTTTNRQASASFVLVLRVRDGRIVHLREYQ